MNTLEEKWLGKEVKIIGGCDYSYLNVYKLIVESILDSESYPITVKIGKTDSYEWFNECELVLVEETNLEKLPLPELVEEPKQDELGKKVVEYCKQYKDSDKYNVSMLAIEFGYQLKAEEDKNLTFSNDNVRDLLKALFKNGHYTEKEVKSTCSELLCYFTGGEDFELETWFDEQFKK